VLLVGRAGRADCGALGVLLSGWDGRLTPRLCRRVQCHIERCPVCRARRAVELRPGRLRGRSPGAALAAGAAESSRRAAAAPPGLRAATIALASGQEAAARAHSAAVLARAGGFGQEGFPRAARADEAGLHGMRAATGGPAVLLMLAALAVAVTLALAGDAPAAVPWSGGAVPVARPRPATGGDRAAMPTRRPITSPLQKVTDK
jgi:hypothetical protein